MILQTERLELILLKPNQIKLWFEDIPSFEKELNCSYRGEPMEGSFLDIVKNQYEAARKDPDRYIWHSFFLLVRKNDRIAVGSADFKDIADENGEVEIGYGLGTEFEHNGYMTEAVKAMCEWALKQNGISGVIAETYLESLASQRILDRCGFKIYKKGDSLWWRFVNTNLTIRMATEKDASEIQEIYSVYVKNTAVTFEYEIPSVAEILKRIKDTLQMYPYLVALNEGHVVGFAYASPFRKRAAYNWAAETTIYLRQDCRGNGIGSKLYLTLGDILKRQNIINLYAGVAYTANEDAYLTNASKAFHEHLGYSKVALFSKCGYKFGKWYDVIWMEKMLGEHTDAPSKLIPVSGNQIDEQKNIF